MKIGLISSRGGHLLQLYFLRDFWEKYDRFWITGKGEDSKHLLKGERVYYGHFPEHRNCLNAIKNFLLGLRLVKKERPSVLISTGAGIGPPVLLAGKILGCKTIFIDSISFIEYPSMSAKLSYFFVDKLLVQHQELTKILKKAEYWGSVLK